jgi:hypothetical protein
VGGPFGFEEYLKALADPDHDEHESWLPLAGALRSLRIVPYRNQ